MLSGILALGLVVLLGCDKPLAVPAVFPLPLSPLKIDPAEATLTTGGGVVFKAGGQDGSQPNLTWEAEGGAVAPNGLYTAPAVPGTCWVQVKAFGGRVARARVTVVPPPTGPITAPGQVLAGARGVKASVPEQPGATYRWTVEGGTLLSDSHGPAVIVDAGSEGKLVFNCRVVNAAGQGLNNTLEVALVPRVAVAITPKSAVMTAGGSRKFGYSLEGGLTGEVVWSVVEPAGGTVDTTGRYHASQVPGTYTVQVAAAEDATAKDSLVVKVVAAPMGEIRGPGPVKAGTEGLRASVPEQEGCTYAWTLTGGRALAGRDTPALTFQAGDGPKLKLTCEITNEAGDFLTLSLDVDVAPNPENQPAQ